MERIEVKAGKMASNLESVVDRRARGAMAGGGARPRGTHGKGRSKPAVTMQDVRAHLATLDKGALADMLVEQAMEDDRLRQRLLMKAAKKGPKGLDAATDRRGNDRGGDTGGGGGCL